MRYFTPILVVLLVGCGEPLNVGSNVLWFADHESGDLEQWTNQDEGGAYSIEAGSAYSAVTDQSRTGAYSVKLTAMADGTDAGAGLFRHWSALSHAYYGVWYYLPRSYETVSYWTILRFRPSSPNDPMNQTLGMDLNLRSLPNGQLVLEVVHQRQAYLHSPVAIPPPIVPVRKWFHIEARFGSSTDESGFLKVWLNDRLVYDIEDRVTNLGTEVYFSPCNLTRTTVPAPVELFVDDALVSMSRITTHGTPRLAD